MYDFFLTRVPQIFMEFFIREMKSFCKVGGKKFKTSKKKRPPKCFLIVYHIFMQSTYVFN